MKNDVQFENTIRIALKKEVEPLAASPYALKKIKERINQEEGTTKTGFRERIANLTYVLNLHKPAVALFCILVFAGLILVFNKPVRVLAQEGINKVVTMIYVVVKRSEGNYDTVLTPIDSSELSYGTGGFTYLEDDELTREAGFNTKTPENLEGGYIFWYTIIVKHENSPQKLICKFYFQGSKKLALQMAANEELLKDKFSYTEIQGEFKIGDVFVKNSELHSPVYQNIQEGNFSKINPFIKPSGIKTWNVMTWEYKGVHYSLSEVNSEVALEELREVTIALVKELQQN